MASIPEYRQFFDPKAYQVVFYSDQRGSEINAEHAELEKKIRRDLINISKRCAKNAPLKWFVFGGSGHAVAGLRRNASR